MTILVVGAGATGGYFGGRLAQAGRDVCFLVRPGRARQLRERGLRIVGQGPDQVIAPRLVTGEELAAGQEAAPDLIVVAVKAAALEPAMNDFAPAVGPGTLILPFLNGMSHLAVLGKRFGDPAVLGGVIRVATQLDDNGDIRQLAPGASLVAGARDGSRSAALEAAFGQLTGAGFDATLSDHIIAEMWHKWVFIATIGALTCLMRGTVGDIVAVPGGRDLGPAILAEASAVSAAAGYPVPGAQTAATSAQVTADGSALASSMFRDLLAGHPVEVEPILGDLIARAAALGVATPVLDLATMQLRVYERIRRAG
jgi:2-dehydropantoate 2-reductase